MHELSVGWLNPLDGAQPTLAEYLGSRGYATAGFVANTMFCARDTGIDRGFTHYEDFIFPEYTALKSAVLVHRVLALLGRLLPVVEQRAVAGVAPPSRSAPGRRLFSTARRRPRSTVSFWDGCPGGPNPIVRFFVS